MKHFALSLISLNLFTAVDFGQVPGQVPVSIFGSAAAAGFTFIQAPTSVSYNNGTTCVIATSSNVTSGHLVFAAITATNAAGLTFTIASNSDTWSTAAANFGSSWSSQAWYLVPSSTEAMSVTITASGGSGSGKCQIGEWSGNSATPLDQAGTTENFSSSATATTSGNLGQNNELAIGSFIQTGGFLTGPGSGFTAAPNVNSPDNVLEYQTVSGGSGATLTCNAALSTTSRTAAICVTFKHP